MPTSPGQLPPERSFQVKLLCLLRQRGRVALLCLSWHPRARAQSCEFRACAAAGIMFDLTALQAYKCATGALELL